MGEITDNGQVAAVGRPLRRLGQNRELFVQKTLHVRAVGRHGLHTHTKTFGAGIEEERDSLPVRRPGRVEVNGHVRRQLLDASAATPHKDELKA